MKTKLTIAVLILTVIILLFQLCGKSTNSEIPSRQINIDSIRAIEREAYELKLLANVQYVEVEVIRDRWHRAKPSFDTIPCDTALKLCITICDTLLVKDSVLIGTQKKVIDKLDSALNGWKVIHSNDSTTIIGQKKQIKKLKRRVWLWKFLFGVSAVGNGVQAVKG